MWSLPSACTTEEKLMQVVMQIARLFPCSCGAHTLVHLAEAGSGRRARLRVSVDAGRHLLAAGAELPSAAGTMVRVLVECLRQLGVQPEPLVLERTGSEFTSRVRLSASRRLEHLEIDPDAGVLLAARQRLPIVLIEDAATAPPRRAERRAGGILDAGDLPRLPRHVAARGRRVAAPPRTLLDASTKFVQAHHAIRDTVPSSHSGQ